MPDSTRTFVPRGNDIVSVEMTERGSEVLTILNTVFDDIQTSDEPADRS